MNAGRVARPPVAPTSDGLGKLLPFQRQEVLQRREAGETLTDIARTYGMAHTTTARL